VGEPFDYPPADHVLRDLPFEMEVGPTSTTAVLAVPGALCAGGSLLVGPLATVVDLLGGSIAAAEVAPDWVATSDLSVHLDLPVPAGRRVTATGRILRSGRTRVVVGVDLHDGAGRSGDAVLGFSRLPRRATTPDISDLRPSGPQGFPRGPDLPELVAWSELLGVRAGELPGTVEASLTARLRNSFGAMNGGVVASIAELAALSVCGADPVGGVVPAARLASLVVHYLGQGREGPVVARATPPVGGGLPAPVRVDIADSGAPTLVDGPSMAVAHAVVVPARGAP